MPVQVVIVWSTSISRERASSAGLQTKLDNSLPGKHESGLCALPRDEKANMVSAKCPHHPVGKALKNTVIKFCGPSFRNVVIGAS